MQALGPQLGELSISLVTKIQGSYGLVCASFSSSQQAVPLPWRWGGVPGIYTQGVGWGTGAGPRKSPS